MRSYASLGVMLPSPLSGRGSRASWSSKPIFRRCAHSFRIAVITFDRTTTPYIRRSSSVRADPWRILICLKMVDFPDSPAPSNSSLTFSSSCCRALSNSRSIPPDFITSCGSSAFFDDGGDAYGLLSPPLLGLDCCAGASADAPQPIVTIYSEMQAKRVRILLGPLIYRTI